MLAAGTGLPQMGDNLGGAQQRAAELAVSAMHDIYVQFHSASSPPVSASAGERVWASEMNSSEEFLEDLAMSWSTIMVQCSRALRSGSPVLKSAFKGSTWIQGLKPNADELAHELQFYPGLVAGLQDLLRY